ncbi:MAG: hydantoinase B/oxoprolinase family protein [Lawsonibacter sp.]
MRKIDQVTLSIMVNNLYWTAEEMNEYLAMAAFSTNIKVRRDCSCAIYTKNGEILAQGEFVPVHLGVMAGVLKEIMKDFLPETMKPGDVYITNDPYRMGSHIFDVMLFKPIFAEGQLIAFTGVLAHHVDIGGAPVTEGCTTCIEEGLRIPPLKLYDQGVLNENIYRFFLNNVRTPYEAKGDLAAQTAANYRGEMRILELVEKYGADMLVDYFEAILDYSEKGMREAIAALPDGESSFEDVVEFDGTSQTTSHIRTKLIISGDELYFDFTGTSAPTNGSVNAPWGITLAAAYYAVKSVLGNNIPTNAGAYRPINLIHPTKPSMVDVQYPSPCSLCTTMPSQRIAEVCIGCFSKIVPEKSCACDGTWLGTRFVGIDPRTGRFSALVETYGAGRGAKYNQDGSDAHQTTMTNTANAPAEITELEHPLQVLKYGLVENSGGPGKFRGGVGITREMMTTAEMDIAVTALRPNSQPYGLDGGSGGQSDFCNIELDPDKIVYSKKRTAAGTKVVIRTSGGGGWGNPLERDFTAIEADILEGYVTIAAAKEQYRVVVDPATGKVDAEETAKLRT